VEQLRLVLSQFQIQANQTSVSNYFGSSNLQKRNCVHIVVTYKDVVRIGKLIHLLRLQIQQIKITQNLCLNNFAIELALALELELLRD
jgi:hypothetical protein